MQIEISPDVQLISSVNSGPSLADLINQTFGPTYIESVQEIYLKSLVNNPQHTTAEIAITIVASVLVALIIAGFVLKSRCKKGRRATDYGPATEIIKPYKYNDNDNANNAQ